MSADDDTLLAAEQAVLATMMDVPTSARECLPLEEGDFANPAHQRIAHAVLSLVRTGGLPTPLATCDHLERGGALPPIVTYARSLVRLAGPLAVAVQQARALHERGILRKLRDVYAQMGQTIDRDDPANLARARAMGLLASGHDGAALEATVQGADLLASSTLDYVESVWSGEVPPPIHCGLGGLDALSPCMKGELMLIGARPSTGKTSLGIQYALEAARRGLQVLFVSLEMKATQLTVRMFAQESHVNIVTMRPGHRGGVSDEERARVLHAAAAIGRLPLGVADRGQLDVEGIVALARAHAIDRGLGLLVVDYLQLIPTPLSDQGRVERHEEVGKLARRLKLVASELDIAVLALAQLNRNAAGARPRLNDLRSSGELEQHADSVAFLSPDLTGCDEVEWEGRPIRPIYCDLAKNRNGPRGTVTLLFNAQTQLFTEVSR